MGTTYSFEDVLSGATVACGYPHLQSNYVEKSAGALSCDSLFFPGCSFINYGLPLVQAVYDTLRQANSVQGISLLCCGKILSYEPGGRELRIDFEREFRDQLKAAGVKRMVVACPNCVAALRDVCASDTATESIAIVALSQELAALGYRIDAQVAQQMARQALSEREDFEVLKQANPSVQISFCTYDSCPDRKTLEFSKGVRLLAENLPIVEAAHNLKKAGCCGSLLRAMGKSDAAEKCARSRGKESAEAGARAIITSCMSCAYQLSMSQTHMPVFHYLELLYNWRIDWRHANDMKLRFLFNDVPRKEGASPRKRAFVALGGIPEAHDAADALQTGTGNEQAITQEAKNIAPDEVHDATDKAPAAAAHDAAGKVNDAEVHDAAPHDAAAKA